MPRNVYSTDEVDAMFALVDEAISTLSDAVADLHAEFDEHTHDVEPPPDPEPEPEPDPGEVVWSTDFSNGFADYTDSTPFTNSGNTDITAVSGPIGGRSGAAARLHVQNASAGDGCRLRQDGGTIDIPGYSGATNLPTHAIYSAWFYLPEHISMNGDPWNIWQFKQTFPKPGGGYRRNFLDSIKLNDLGDRYGFTTKSRVTEDGGWQSSPFTEWHNDDVTVQAGEWFHITEERVFGGPGVGHILRKVNGELMFDLDWPTECYDGGFEDFGNWRRQWTVNNYVTGTHRPNTHDVYAAELEIRLP